MPRDWRRIPRWPKKKSSIHRWQHWRTATSKLFLSESVPMDRNVGFHNNCVPLCSLYFSCILKKKLFLFALLCACALPYNSRFYLNQRPEVAATFLWGSIGCSRYHLYDSLHWWYQIHSVKIAEHGLFTIRPIGKHAVVTEYMGNWKFFSTLRDQKYVEEELIRRKLPLSMIDLTKTELKQTVILPGQASPTPNNNMRIWFVI